jgi:hypothetical protein
MAYITAEARQELLDTVGEATEELGVALGALGDAYEQLDERSAETLEEQLFRPAQAAYARAKRTHTDFAARHGLPAGAIKPPPVGLPSTGVKGFVEAAAEALERAESILVELQDSMSPVEVGDPEVRAGIADVRAMLAELAGRPERFVSRFGR